MRHLASIEVVDRVNAAMRAVKGESAVDAFSLVFLGDSPQLDAQASEHEIFTLQDHPEGRREAGIVAGQDAAGGNAGVEGGTNTDSETKFVGGTDIAQKFKGHAAEGIAPVRSIGGINVVAQAQLHGKGAVEQDIDAPLDVDQPTRVNAGAGPVAEVDRSQFIASRSDPETDEGAKPRAGARLRLGGDGQGKESCGQEVLVHECYRRIDGSVVTNGGRIIGASPAPEAAVSRREDPRICKIAMQMFVRLQYPMYTSKFAAEGCPSG